jgi:peptidoglycan hydrolase CwlO-like protein
MTVNTNTLVGRVVLFIFGALFWLGVASVLTSLSGCGPRPVASADVLAAAQPKSTADVSLKPASDAARDTGDALDRLGKQVDDAERQAEDARELNQKSVLTIVELRELLRQTDEDVNAREVALKAAAKTLIDKLEAEIVAKGELDEQRQVTISRLKAENNAAILANKVTKNKLQENAVELQATKDELYSYRDLYPIAVGAVKTEGENTEVWRKKAEKNQYWASSWWKWCVVTFMVTCILWVLALVYLSITTAPPGFARKVARKVLFTG